MTPGALGDVEGHVVESVRDVRVAMGTDRHGHIVQSVEA